MPSRYAVRELTLTYREEAENEILAFLKQHVKYDYLKGKRELSLDMSIRNAELLFAASDYIRGLADSGELKALHDKTEEVQNQVQTGFLTVMD